MIEIHQKCNGTIFDRIILLIVDVAVRNGLGITKSQEGSSDVSDVHSLWSISPKFCGVTLNIHLLYTINFHNDTTTTTFEWSRVRLTLGAKYAPIAQWQSVRLQLFFFCLSGITLRFPHAYAVVIKNFECFNFLRGNQSCQPHCQAIVGWVQDFDNLHGMQKNMTPSARIKARHAKLVLC